MKLKIRPRLRTAVLASVGLILIPTAVQRVRAPGIAAARSAGANSSAPGKRILVYYDMEGLSGQSDWRTASFEEGEYYRRGQDLLVEDVNAVVRGLAAGGASLIDVVDYHGSGNHDSDLPPSRLDAHARAIARDEPFEPGTDLVKPGVYDGVAAVAMHAKTSTRGFLAHTFEIGLNISLNGHWITETEFLGYSWGRVGAPIILVSGDDKLAEDLQTMPWLKYVISKHATGTISAELLPPEQVHEALQQSAKVAVQNLRTAEVMNLKTPIQVVVRASPPESLSVLKDVPGVKYQNESVSFAAKDLDEAGRGITALANIGTQPFQKFVLEELQKQANAAEVQRHGLEEMIQRYADAEEGRWTSQPHTKPPTASDGKYYGDR